jgi:hypothetical protein
MKKLYSCLYCLLLLLTQVRVVEAQSIQQLGPNYFTAGVPSMEFYTVADIGRQRCPEWCWAASSQMILNYHGLYVSQEQIVAKIFGSLECRPGNDVDILNGLTGWAPDTRGRYSEIFSLAGIDSPVDIVNNLAYKWPLLVCLRNPDGSGHAEVMTAVYYAIDSNNNPIIDKVVLRDPWPYNPSRQEMSWAEFTSRATDIIKVWVVRN